MTTKSEHDGTILRIAGEVQQGDYFSLGGWLCKVTHVYFLYQGVRKVRIAFRVNDHFEGEFEMREFSNFRTLLREDEK